MEGVDFEAFIEDIRANGLREPIVTFEAAILDGRNRERACVRLGIPRRYEPYDGPDALAFVISRNCRRRHLTTIQRAEIAVKLATMRQGERTDRQPSENLPKVSQGQAAATMNVSERTMRSMKVVKEKGSPELQKALAAKELSLSRAKKRATPH